MINGVNQQPQIFGSPSLRFLGMGIFYGLNDVNDTMDM
jgi:hypothetical protein